MGVQPLQLGVRFRLPQELGDQITPVGDGAVCRFSKPPGPDGVGHTTIPLTDRKR
jgi:hypothetical protein